MAQQEELEILELTEKQNLVVISLKRAEGGEGLNP